MPTPTPNLIYIDDEQDLVEGLAGRLKGHANVVEIVTHVSRIEEIKSESLKADIVVSDWNLKATLLAAGGLGFADGGALIEGIASWRRSSDFIHVIFSGELQSIEALEEVPSAEFASHPHILARRLGVDWVGQKRFAEKFYKSLEQLSLAARRMNAIAAEETRFPVAILHRLLAPDNDQSIDENLAEDIPAYGPPKIEVSSARRFDVVRWLLLEVLPYPTFLIDAEEVARRLRVKPSWFATTESAVKERFLHAKYNGILNDIGLGERWWARQVESKLWDLSDGGAIYGEAWQQKLAGMSVPAEHLLQEPDPVIARGYFGASTGKIFNVSEMVRISPPHWPSAGSQAYARKTDVLEDVFLRQIANPNDIGDD